MMRKSKVRDENGMNKNSSFSLILPHQDVFLYNLKEKIFDGNASFLKQHCPVFQHLL